MSPEQSMWLLGAIALGAVVLGRIPLWLLGKLWAWQDSRRERVDQRRTQCLICKSQWDGRCCSHCGFEPEPESQRFLKVYSANVPASGKTTLARAALIFTDGRKKS